jgi:hypothetical protein
MGAPDDGQIATHSRAHDGDANDITAPKTAAEQKTTIEISEQGQIEDAPKTYYSKLSIWLMILYSGLAIGSDG